MKFISRSRRARYLGLLTLIGQWGRKLIPRMPLSSCSAAVGESEEISTEWGVLTCSRLGLLPNSECWTHDFVPAISQKIIDRDISICLECSLETVRQYCYLASDWSGKKDIRRLVSTHSLARE